LKKIAKVNGNGNSVVDISTTTEMDSKENDQQEPEEKANDKEKRSLLKFIFNSKVQMVRALLLSFVWFALTLIYYGVSLG
jgi:hypothetical protein